MCVPWWIRMAGLLKPTTTILSECWWMAEQPACSRSNTPARRNVEVCPPPSPPGLPNDSGFSDYPEFSVSSEALNLKAQKKEKNFSVFLRLTIKVVFYSCVWWCFVFLLWILKTKRRCLNPKLCQFVLVFSANVRQKDFLTKKNVTKVSIKIIFLSILIKMHNNAVKLRRGCVFGILD